MDGHDNHVADGGITSIEHSWVFSFSIAEAYHRFVISDCMSGCIANQPSSCRWCGTVWVGRDEALLVNRTGDGSELKVETIARP